MISTDLLDKLNILYDRVPYSITRVVSTYAHNKAVGGSDHSWHLDLSTDFKYARPCGAADLIFDSAELAQKAVRECQLIGFGGIEWDMTNSHLHVDVRPLTTKWWVMKTDVGEQPLPSLGSYSV